MTIWVLRFISYHNPQSFDLYFKTGERALRWYDEAVKRDAPSLRIADDYGVVLSVDPNKCAAILTNTDASAAFNADLAQANKEAGALRFVGGVESKSTVQ